MDLESGTCSTVKDVGSFNMMGDSSCNSKRFERVEGTLGAVGKSLGLNSLKKP